MTKVTAVVFNPQASDAIPVLGGPGPPSLGPSGHSAWAQSLYFGQDSSSGSDPRTTVTEALHRSAPRSPLACLMRGGLEFQRAPLHPKGLHAAT